MPEHSKNPFKIGDKVQFCPNERAQGWSWFGPGTIQPNDIGVIARIEREDYIYIENDLGGFHWQCFRATD